MRKSLTKFIYSLSLLFVLLLITIPVAFSWIINKYEIQQPIIGNISSHFAGGDGTVTNPYLITTPEHFYNLSYLQNLGYFNDVKYFFEIPTNSQIDFTNTQYKSIPPIGTYNYPFISELYGNNSVLKGYIVNGVSMQDIGTFGYLGSNAVISNLILNSPTIISEPAIDIVTTNFHTHNDLQENIATGYIAGHVAIGASLNNVFVVSPTINSKLNAFSNRSQYGLIGYSEQNSGEIPGGPRDQKYGFTLDTAMAASKIYQAVMSPSLSGYYVYGNSSVSLRTAITAISTTDVTINAPYSLSTLRIASNSNPDPVYFYDKLEELVGPIGTGDKIYVKENIDLVGQQIFTKGELNLTYLDLTVPLVNTSFIPTNYQKALILYVRPTNNLTNLGQMTTIKANQAANLTFKKGYNGTTYLEGQTALTTIFTSPLTMNAVDAFTAVKVETNGSMTVVNPAVEVPDYYVFLMGTDKTGTTKITSIDFQYVPAILDQNALADISGVDFINENEITTLQQGVNHTFSYVNFGYEITGNQKINIRTTKNVEVFEIYFSDQITDGSYFYIDIINILGKQINIYHITYNELNEPTQTLVYSNINTIIELRVDGTGVTLTIP